MRTSLFGHASTFDIGLTAGLGAKALATPTVLTSTSGPMASIASAAQHAFEGIASSLVRHLATPDTW